jgi:molybdate transport system substrate-binding protein
MMLIYRPIIGLLMAISLLVPRVAQADAPTIYAAASLRGALDHVIAAYLDATDNPQPLVSYAATSTLARQIDLGARVDIFIAANVEWVSYLQDRDLIAAPPDTLLENRLVLIGSTGSPPVDLTPDAITQRLQGGKLAIALTDAVPAGIYGKSALQSLGLWPALSAHLAQTDNVRTALAYVAQGAVPLALVYGSDAKADPRVSIIADIPIDSHPAIKYPVAIIKPYDAQTTRDFKNFLFSDGAGQIFLEHGFDLPQD